MMQIMGTVEKAGHPASPLVEMYSFSFANAQVILVTSTEESSG
jgi:hypothetical protein